MEQSDEPDSRRLFFEFLKDPTGENYLMVWRRLTASPEYAPYSSEVSELQKLYEQGDFAEAKARGYAVVGKWLLSPRLHFLLCFACRMLGEERESQMEGMIAMACIQGILGTGDGSEERPYVVTSTGDEYDILLHMKKELKLQSLCASGQRMLDRMSCRDGSTVYFDITTAYARLQQRMRGRKGEAGAEGGPVTD